MGYICQATHDPPVIHASAFELTCTVDYHRSYGIDHRGQKKLTLVKVLALGHAQPEEEMLR